MSSPRRARTRIEATADVPSAVASPLPDDADELHRRATELREYRMGRGARPPGLETQAMRTTDTGTTVVTFPVLGMTCRACEVRIAKHVGHLPNVERVTASAVRGMVTVECAVPVSAAAIEQAINKAGYEIGRTPWLARDAKVWGTAGAGLVFIAAVALVAQVTGAGDLASGAGDLSSGGLLVALLLGLAAGVSTCMAMVGGLVLGLSASFAAQRAERGEQAGAATALRPALLLVGGRIAGYALFGAVLGAVGATLSLPPMLTAILMIGVALVMTILGTRLTGVSPRVAGWSPTLPMGLGTRLGLGGDGGASGGAAYSDARAATLGSLTFFLPCGFTQTVQIYALSTGSPAFAAALLGVFALGTAPGLLALAGLPVLVPGTFRPTLLRLVGVVVLGFALLNLTSGLRLSGIGLPSFVGFASAAPLPGTLTAGGIQVITTHQDADGYSPANVVIYAGYPTRWTIESSTTATCAASLWAPAVNLRVRLAKGVNTFELPPMEAGTLNYTCAMGMYGGRITIVDPPAAGAASDG
jgi:sulfite exporter TauE/SafE/copper chaperone CopZ